MQIATLNNKSISKKNLTYIAGGVIAVLAIVGIGLGFYIFQTPSQASETAPQNVSITPAGTSGTVSWTTPAETIAVIEYGTQPDAGTFGNFAFSDSPTTMHTVDITSLQPNTTYYFQIRIGQDIFDNEGSFWSFTTAAATPSPLMSLSPSPASPAASLTVTTIPTLSIQPTPSMEATISATLTPSISINPTTITPGLSPGSISGACPYTSCTAIQNNLGPRCSTQDYIRCILNNGGSTTTTPTSTPIPTSAPSGASGSAVLSAATKIGCGIDYFQTNSCKSFSWTDVAMKNPTCANTYTKYFVQCKSNSFNSTDAATWYCNQTTSDTSITVPCGNAPTPAPGQSIFCRVRAETPNGGGTNATAWMYASTSCPRYPNNGSCDISFIQGNTCRSWLWDRVNNTNPHCAAAFDHYSLQCTSNGDFTGASGTWYCDNASTNHYLDLPCFNAPTPADGSTIHCRVRAEDAYGGDNHSTGWVSASAVCPTSTPTPTPTNTPTPTPTPTP